MSKPVNQFNHEEGVGAVSQWTPGQYLISIYPPSEVGNPKCVSVHLWRVSDRWYDPPGGYALDTVNIWDGIDLARVCAALDSWHDVVMGTCESCGGVVKKRVPLVPIKLTPVAEGWTPPARGG